MSRVPLRISTLVSTQWLANRIASSVSGFRIIDASWHLPVTKRNARSEYNECHIPGALFHDLDENVDKTSQYDHMLPPADQFCQYVGKLGISNNTHVIVYDNNETYGLFSSQRLWWTFRVFGYHQVSILDGGLPKWIRDGYETTEEVPVVPVETFRAQYHPELVKSFEDMERIVADKSFQVVDVRSAGRFAGQAPEPRLGIKPGHMPGAFNIPFTEFIEPNEKTLKSPDALRRVFEDAGVDLNRPVVGSCGTGVTACFVPLAASLCSRPDADAPVYDGAWMEWYLRAGAAQKVNVPI